MKLEYGDDWTDGCQPFSSLVEIKFDFGIPITNLGDEAITLAPGFCIGSLNQVSEATNPNNNDNNSFM